MRPEDNCIIGFHRCIGQVVQSRSSCKGRVRYRMGWWHHINGMTEESWLQPLGPRIRFKDDSDVLRVLRMGDLKRSEHVPKLRAIWCSAYHTVSALASNVKHAVPPLMRCSSDVSQAHSKGGTLITPDSRTWRPDLDILGPLRPLVDCRCDPVSA